MTTNRSGVRIVSLEGLCEAGMDTLTSSSVILLQTKLFKQILRRSVRAVAWGANYAGVSRDQHSHNLQISRDEKPATWAQYYPFLELIIVLEQMRSQPSSSLGKKIGRSSLNIEVPPAREANHGASVTRRVESFGIGQQQPWRTNLNDKEGAISYTKDHSAVEFETRAEDAIGTCAIEVHETSQDATGPRSEKKAKSKRAGGDGTSEEQTAEDERFMLEALLEAKKAASIGEVPVGAVIVQKGRIIARAYNRVEAEGDPTAHAELLCIRSASKTTGDWRLTDATIYVTMEPCPMCAGALLQARVKRVVWGARNTLLGADGSWVSLFPNSEQNHSINEGRARHVQHPFHKKVEVRRELLPRDCSMILRSFFRSRRKGNVPAAKRKPRWLPLEFWILYRKLIE